MNTRRLNYLYHRFMFIKAWYFFLPAIIFGVLAIYGLRHNYSTMVKLREEVYKTDQQNGDVEAALSKLRAHVYGHMNTNLSSGSNAIKPPIQLKARYDRLAATENERIRGQNAAVASQGEQICAQQFPGTGFNAPRVACVQDYVGNNTSDEQTIPDQLYKFDFISPRWSPDLAGISLFFSSIFFILFFSRVLIERYIKNRLKH